jgi:hypothetical protein
LTLLFAPARTFRYSRCMSKQFYRLIAGVVLMLAAMMPLVECLDRWDGSSTTPSNDTELRLMVGFTGIGALLTLAKLVRRDPDIAMFVSRVSHAGPDKPQLREGCSERLEPATSPPPLLLRI